jgi:hypothetical protein
MLEVQGVLRSQTMRMRLNRELAVGETLDAHGRRWEITSPRPANSLRLDRRIVAREMVEPARFA